MTSRDCIVATLAYADVFDYPLTEEEMRRWLVKSTQSKVHSTQLKKISEIRSIHGHFFLEGRKKIIALRKQRKRWVGEKMRVAQRAATVLQCIPTIQLVGVTGALAMENAHRDDDVDFYVVTKRGTLWTSRFLATTLLGLFGLRRKPKDTAFRNKICLNMYVDEDHLAVRSRERDLFTAHEVLQMKPLWARNETYQEFLSANSWVQYLLPNAWFGKMNTRRIKQKKSLFTIFEPMARTLQLWYMNSRKTSEVVSPTLIRFHPRDARVWVKERFSATLARLNVPLDKIFYAR